MAFPASLKDLQRGATIPGDTNADPSVRPDWLDPDRLAQARGFLRRHAFTMALIWHCSLTIGFALPSLLEALVYTGKSNTPRKCVTRYTATFQRLIQWHQTDIFDQESTGFKSVQAVRGMHAGVRAAMDKAHYRMSRHWISMYDMAMVQAGFMGAISIVHAKFGLRCSDAQMDDYIYFWRCVGHQLGIADQYNLCGGGQAVAAKIVWEAIDQVIVPSSEEPPADFDPMAQAYIDGIDSFLPVIKIFSVRSVLAVVYWTLGVRQPVRLGCADTVRFWGCRLLFVMIATVPFFERVASLVTLAVIKLLPGPSTPCPHASRAGPSPHGELQPSWQWLWAVRAAVLAGLLVWLLLLAGFGLAVAGLGWALYRALASVDLHCALLSPSGWESWF